MKFFSITILLLFSVSTVIGQQYKLVKDVRFSKVTMVNSAASDVNSLWLGTDKGIFRFEMDSVGNIFDITNRTTSQPVLALENGDKRLWVGIKGKGLYLFNKKNYQFTGLQKKALGKSDIVFLKERGGVVEILTKKNKAFDIKKNDESFLKSIDAEAVQKELKKDQTPPSSYVGKYKLISNKVFEFNGRSYLVSTKGILKVEGKRVSNVEKIDTTVVAHLELKVDSSVSKSSDNSDSQEGVPTLDTVPKKESEKEVLQKHPELTTTENNVSKEHSWLYYVMLGMGLLVYSVVIVLVTARKYMKDIRVLEDEILESKKN